MNALVEFEENFEQLTRYELAIVRVDNLEPSGRGVERTHSVPGCAWIDLRSAALPG
jgi:hypothetical protein